MLSMGLSRPITEAIFAYIVLTKLVREFYAHLEVVQNKNSGVILQSTIVGHVIMVDPQVISQIIGMPML